MDSRVQCMGTSETRLRVLQYNILFDTIYIRRSCDVSDFTLVRANQIETEWYIDTWHLYSVENITHERYRHALRVRYLP